MEKFLRYIIPLIVDNKEAINIVKNEMDGSVVFTITVSKEDMGKVIGKEGKIINAIRNLVKILAVKEKQRVIVQLSEPQ